MKSMTDDIKNNIIQDLYDDLDLYLESNPNINVVIDQKDPDYYGGGLHCSRLGWCIRAEVLDYNNFPKKKHNLQTKLTFMRGNFYHELVYKWLENSTKFNIIAKELTLNELKKPYRGRFDVCFSVNNLQINILSDVKTAHPNQFKSYSKYLPKLEHINQLSAYYLGYKKNTDLLLMMYFSAGSDHPQFYFVEPNKDIETLMQTYIDAVNEYDKTEVFPERISDKKQKWNCDYCDFNGISCDGFVESEQDKKIEEFNEFVRKASD